MKPLKSQCQYAREISEARHCAHRDGFAGEVGSDVLPWMLTHDEKLDRALDERDRTGKRVVDTPLYAALLVLAGIGIGSGFTLLAGWV